MDAYSKTVYIAGVIERAKAITEPHKNKNHNNI